MQGQIAWPCLLVLTYRALAFSCTLYRGPILSVDEFRANRSSSPETIPYPVILRLGEDALVEVPGLIAGLNYFYQPESVFRFATTP